MRNVTVRGTVVATVLCAAALGGGLAALQQSLGSGVFEYQQYGAYAGRIRLLPYPVLISGQAMLPLAGEGKFGVARELAGMDGRAVQLEGARILRQGDEMLEVRAGSPRLAAGEGASAPPELLGTFTFAGEIVDSKCYLGVMNPGAGRVHRECAIRCISGGVPPVLAVRDDMGKTRLLWLTGAEGEPLSKEILDYVAEPLRASGRLYREGTLLYFRIDLSSLRRE